MTATPAAIARLTAYLEGVDYSYAMENASSDFHDDLRAALSEITHLRAELATAYSVRDAAEAQAHAALVEVARKWRPIESAPKDGTRVLLYTAGGDGEDEDRTIAEGSWGKDPWMVNTWCMEGGDFWPGATHWRPLPAPPVTP